jgi:hypothetical protein
MNGLTKAHALCLGVLRELAEKLEVNIENIRDAAGSHKKVDLVRGDKRIIVTIYKAREQDQRTLLNYKSEVRRRILKDLYGRNA